MPDLLLSLYWDVSEDTRAFAVVVSSTWTWQIAHDTLREFPTVTFQAIGMTNSEAVNQGPMRTISVSMCYGFGVGREYTGHSMQPEEKKPRRSKRLNRLGSTSKIVP